MKVLLLMNPASRGTRGQRLWPLLIDALERRRIDYEKHVLSDIREAYDTARSARSFDVIAAVGGDGTVNAVAAGVLANPDPALRFAVLYAGTSPDFCRFHRIPTDPEAAVELLVSGTTRKIPVLRANGHPFFCSCNPGMGAEIASAANHLRPFFGDRAGTFLALIRALLLNRKWNYRLGSGETLDGCGHLLITRMPYIAGGIKIRIPELKSDEYVLWYLRNVSRLDWLKLLPELYRGNIGGTLSVRRGNLSITCSGAQTCALEFDGDPHGTLPLEISMSSEPLNLICGKEKERDDE